jgi:hypothetical protein
MSANNDDSNTWETDAKGYRQAVADDEYAELRLETGDHLITDWEFADSSNESAQSQSAPQTGEGDGVFLPYVVPDVDDGLDGRDPEADEVQVEVAEAIEDALNTEVHDIEWSPSNDAWYPFMNRPDN